MIKSPIFALVLSVAIGVCLTGASTAQTPKNLPRDEWMGVFYGSNRVGYRNITIAKDKFDGKDVYRMDDFVFAQARFGGAKVLEYDLDLTTFIGMDFAPICSTWSTSCGDLSKADADKTVSQYSGNALYVFDKNSVALKIDSGGKIDYRRISSKRDDLIESCMYALGGKEISRWDKAAQYSHMNLSIGGYSYSGNMSFGNRVEVSRRESITIDGKHYNPLVLEGEDFTAWVTDDGELLKETSKSSPISFVHETREEALRDIGKVNHDILAIEADRDIPDATSVTDLRVRLVGLLDRDMVKNDIRQTAEAHPEQGMVEYHIAARAFDPSKSLLLPVKDKVYRKWLKQSPGIESDSPEIRKLATEIVGGEKSAYTAACKLRAWVFGNIKYDWDKHDTLPNSALEILKAKSGVCAHHAILFTALARACGIPTRTVVGPWYGGGPFGFHAWAECYVGEWVAFDPTTEKDFVDATHIKMLEGGIETMSDYYREAGRLRAEIVDYKYLYDPNIHRERPDCSLCPLLDLNPNRYFLYIPPKSYYPCSDWAEVARALCDPSNAGLHDKFILGCPHKIFFEFTSAHAPQADVCKLHGDAAPGTLIVIDKNGNAKRYPHGIDPQAVLDATSQAATAASSTESTLVTALSPGITKTVTTSKVNR